MNRPDVVYTQHRVNADRQGQGVLLVTEPHSELNAGLVVVFSSAHPSIFNWGEWTRRCRCLPDTEYNSLLASAAEKVVQEFLKLLTGFLHRTLSSNDLTPQEKQQWVQSGLALSPLVATCTQYSVDFCLAWALIFFFFYSLAERAITAVPVTALQKEAIVTSSAMPRFHQAETKNKGRQRKKQPSKTNNTTPTKHKPQTKHLSGNRAAYACTTYN